MVGVEAEVMPQVVCCVLEVAVCLNECYVRRPWVYIGEVGFCSLVTDLPMLLGAWPP